jgi:hypothetical protein
MFKLRHAAYLAFLLIALSSLSAKANAQQYLTPYSNGYGGYVTTSGCGGCGSISWKIDYYDSTKSTILASTGVTPIGQSASLNGGTWSIAPHNYNVEWVFCNNQNPLPTYPNDPYKLTINTYNGPVTAWFGLKQ